MEDETLEIAKYISNEISIYFKKSPFMYKILQKIEIKEYEDKTVLIIPEEIYNISSVKDKFLMEKCIEKAIKRYMEDNGVMGSVY